MNKRHCTGSQVKKCIPGAVGAPRRGARKIIVHPWVMRAAEPAAPTDFARSQEKHPAFIGTVGVPRRGTRKIIVHLVREPEHNGPICF